MTNMKRDIHIMAYRPEQYFDRMEIGENDIVSVHYEACDNLHEVISEIRSRGASPFIALSPDTKPEVLLDFLNEIDGVLVMTVYPGFAGRPIVEGSFEKIQAVRKLIDDSGKNLLLEVDGHVSWELCAKMRACGGDMFVAGSSSLYQKGQDIKEAVERMSALIA
jgi:ribulose-phosphate 3-epimerase